MMTNDPWSDSHLGNPYNGQHSLLSYNDAAQFSHAHVSSVPLNVGIPPSAAWDSSYSTSSVMTGRISASQQFFAPSTVANIAPGVFHCEMPNVTNLPSRKDRNFHVQQDKLRSMGLAKTKLTSTMNPDELISSMMNATVRPNGTSAKPLPRSHQALPVNGPACGIPTVGGIFKKNPSMAVEPHAPTAAVDLYAFQPSSVASVGMQNGSVHHSQGLLELMKLGHAPPWLRNWHTAPKLYQELASTVCGSSGNLQPDPVKAFNVFASSGLPGHLLSHLWSIVHPQDDPSFELPEFFAVLALIAIVQRTSDAESASLAALMSMAIPPLPNVTHLPSEPCAPPNVTPSAFNFDFGFSPPAFEEVKMPFKSGSTSEEKVDDDEFGDFQASDATALQVVDPCAERAHSPFLMSPTEYEDKYAALRSLTDLSETRNEIIAVNPSAEPVVDNVSEVPVRMPSYAPSPVPESPDSIPQLPEVLSLEKLPAPIAAPNFSSPGLPRKAVIQSSASKASEDDFGDFVAASERATIADIESDMSQITLREETRSVASLEFATNAHLSEADCDSFSNWAINPVDVDTPVQLRAAVEPQPQFTEFVAPTDNSDKYSVFRDISRDLSSVDDRSSAEELFQTSEKLWDVGSAAFKEALAVLEEATKLDCLDEFLAHSKGLEYTLCLLEVFAVGARARSSFDNYLKGDRDRSSAARKAWQDFWTSFDEFFSAVKRSNAPVLRSVSIDDLERNPAGVSSGPKCGVCLTPASEPVRKVDQHGPAPGLVPVLASLLVGRSDSEESRFCLNAQTIQWGVSRYHVSCANLWLNRVNSVLPALAL